MENQTERVITDEEGGVVHLPIATTKSAGIASFDERFFLVTEDGKVEPRGFVESNGENGKAATITIGTVTTGPPGSEASVTNVGTPSEAILNFTIPRGDPGEDGKAATIAIGTVTTGPPGSEASVTNVGTPSEAILNFI